MTHSHLISPWRVLIPVGLGTSLSLLGDTSLYTVLPTHTVEAGVAIARVGILLSANRWIRLLLNGPAGLAYERWPRRRLFVPALFIGALSTAIYALTQGFWPLLVGRLLWGLAWAGIWVGGNTIILDMTHVANRGRWVGAYQVAFFLGASSGSLLGGILTDVLGYHQAMSVAASLTLVGALFALIFLPETRRLRPAAAAAPGDDLAAALLPAVAGAPIQTASPDPRRGQAYPERSRRETLAEQPGECLPKANGGFLAVLALFGVNRLVMPGLLMSTFALYLAQRLGNPANVAGRTLGVATLTGVLFSINALVSMVSSPLFGGLSDRLGDRWRAVAWGLAPGVAGFGLLAFASPLVALLGMPFTAIAAGSNAGLATALVGDSGRAGRHGRRLGVLFTTGDLTSAVGPPLAFVLIPWIGLRGVYLLAGGLFGVMLLLALRQGYRTQMARLQMCD